MKKLAKITIITLLLLVITIIATPFLINLDNYKEQITAQVKQKTGRDLTIDGHIKANIFPVFGISIDQVSLTNLANYHDKHILQTQSIIIEIELAALLEKKLQIKRFILTKPIINLEIKNNQPNWKLSAQKTITPQNSTTNNHPTTNNSGSLFAGLMLGDVQITDGTINFRDNTAKRNLEIGSLNLKATLPAINQPLNLNANAILNGEKIATKIKVVSPDKILANDNSAVEFNLESTPTTFNFIGEAGQTSINGKIDLQISSVPLLLKMLSQNNNNRFTGTINVTANLGGKISSTQEFISTLGGKAFINVTDGVIKGIDLKNMVNNIKTAFADTASQQIQTEFSQMSGNFMINNGIISNNDLNLQAPLITLLGKGTINLPQQTIKYHLSPAVQSTVKRGDGSATKGLEIPIIIEGPLNDPRFLPDLSGLVKNTLENPNALRNTVKTLKEQLKNGKQGIEGVQDLLQNF